MNPQDVKQNWDKNIKKFLKDYDIEFKNLNIYKTAFTHSSYSEHNNYERLEFIGDRILNLAASMKTFEETSGRVKKLNEKFESLISNKNLARIANKLNFEKMILLQSNNKKIEDSILADSIEAIIGAICIDADLDESYEFAKKILEM